MKRRTFLTTAGLATAAVTVPAAAVTALSAQPKDTPQKAAETASSDPTPAPRYRRRHQKFRRVRLDNECCRVCLLTPCIHCECLPCEVNRAHCPQHPILPVPVYQLLSRDTVPAIVVKQLSELVDKHHRVISWFRDTKEIWRFNQSSSKPPHIPLALSIQIADELVDLANKHELGVYWHLIGPRSSPTFYRLADTSKSEFANWFYDKRHCTAYEKSQASSRQIAEELMFYAEQGDVTSC